jgi:hypothetical protein
MIKTDAEGMQADILAGGSNLLSTSYTFVLFENFLDYKLPHRTFAPLELLPGYGYRLFVPLVIVPRQDRTLMMPHGANVATLIAPEIEVKNRLIRGESREPLFGEFAVEYSRGATSKNDRTLDTRLCKSERDVAGKHCGFAKMNCGRRACSQWQPHTSAAGQVLARNNCGVRIIMHGMLV